MNSFRRRLPPPFFSICIPQYDRTSFLLVALRSLEAQSFRDFEICISDDCSPDGRQAEVVAFLEASGFDYSFRTRDTNGRYDANLRSAIELARGRYCVLMGNDDAFNGPNALALLNADMERMSPAGVVISDFEDYATGKKAERIRRTANYGCGPEVAAGHYRNFSFVSGIVLEREPAQSLATDRWDGSEMYQTFVGCRMIASGRILLERRQSLVRKDIVVLGEGVDSYARKPRLWPCPLVERPLPLGKLPALVACAVAPPCGVGLRHLVNENILRQFLLFTYPYWLLEYRRVQSWRFSFGICLGMRPAKLMDGIALPVTRRGRMVLLYVAVSVAALLTPLVLFDRLCSRLYALAKESR